MAKSNAKRFAPLPARQEFRSHQRDEFNAAIQAGAKAGYLLSIERDANGETVAIIHRDPLTTAVLS